MIRKVFFVFLAIFTLNVAAHELVMDHDFPDPTLLKAPDGHYYAYATQGTLESGNPQVINIQIARSRDLKNWKHLGEALPEKPAWARTTQAFWAPHIHEANGRYYLFYSADPDTKKGLCLAVAVAKKPEGPFVDSGSPLQCGHTFSNIDPMIWKDPSTSKSYMYWGSGFDPIRMREMDPSLLKFADNSKTVELVSPDRSATPAPYMKLLEGAWLLPHKNYFYLFVSGENCCSGSDPQYAVLVLRSRSPFGPFEWKEGDPRKSVVIESNNRFKATGHNALIHDAEGTLWSFHHGVDLNQPYLRAPIPGDRTNRRVLLRSALKFSDGWPVVK